VIIMTTADRIDSVGYRAWTPSSAPPVVAADEETYVGKHRRPGSKSFSLHRMFYTARHLARGR
jgi:hypothetical protein